MIRIRIVLLLNCCLLGLVCRGASAQDINQEKWEMFKKQVERELSRRHPIETRREAITQFKQHDYKQAGSYLVEMLKTSRTPLELKLEVSRVLQNFKDPAVVALVETATKETRGTNRYLLEVFVAHGNPESRNFLLGLVKDAKSPGIKATAIAGVAALPADDIHPNYTKTLLTWLNDEDTYPGVKLAAARAMARIQQEEVIPGLIAKLDDPLLVNDCRDSLLRLTGQEFWLDKLAWEQWWQDNQANYQFQPLDDQNYTTKHKQLMERFGDNNLLDADFYGRKVEGKNIVFILDNSGSMAQDGRMDRLKTELQTMIGALNENYRIGLVLFPKQNVPGKEFDQADDRYRERILEFVDEMIPEGGTPMVDALEHTFKRIVAKNKVDTIYLLSDGVPSDLDDGNTLTGAILRYNELYDVKINTIFIGDNPEGQALMKKVAEDSGGTFFAVP